MFTITLIDGARYLAAIFTDIRRTVCCCCYCCRFCNSGERDQEERRRNDHTFIKDPTGASLSWSTAEERMSYPLRPSRTTRILERPPPSPSVYATEFQTDKTDEEMLRRTLTKLFGGPELGRWRIESRIATGMLVVWAPRMLSEVCSIILPSSPCLNFSQATKLIGKQNEKKQAEKKDSDGMRTTPRPVQVMFTIATKLNYGSST